MFKIIILMSHALLKKAYFVVKMVCFRGKKSENWLRKTTLASRGYNFFEVGCLCGVAKGSGKNI
jgi:hypothetical protein